MKLAEECPKITDIPIVATFITKCFGAFESLIYSWHCRIDDLQALLDELPLNTPHCQELSDVVQCYPDFEDHVIGCFQGSWWCFRWEGRRVLTADSSQRTLMAEEYLAV